MIATIDEFNNVRSSQPSTIGIWRNLEEKIENLEFDTFQQHTNKVFNKLSVNIRICENKRSFINKARSFYKDKALARTLFL